MCSNKTQTYKKLFKLDITESGGVTESLKLSMIELFKKAKYYILVEEGGEGTTEHYHLHGIISSNYKASNNFRRKVLKPLYKTLNKECTPWGIKVTEVTGLDGALSYVYKDKRVLVTSGIVLDSIEPWKVKPKGQNRLKQFTLVNKNNFLEKLISYIDTKGIKPPGEYQDVRNIIQDMMTEKYRFAFGNWTRSSIGQLLTVYGSQAYSLSFLDQLCNFPA